ncbi:MAG: hypothetical protein JKX92_15515 [Porticoccaceae bacterium]|nr:hypothetical protein [Porticoccaceae bacterium]
MFQRIKYEELNSRQKENFNFQKVASELANFGYNCMWLNDDWQGADFIACHIDGNTFIKIQLKGRLTISKKYNGKDIYVAFNQNQKWYIYPHDQLQEELLGFGLMSSSKSWNEVGAYSWPNIPKNITSHMEQYAL